MNRKFLLKMAVTCSAIAFGFSVHAATVKIGALYDLTGDLNIYGIQQSRALKLAVKKINAEGGVNGDQIEIVEYDTQSDDSKYTQYATTLAIRDNVKAIFGGLASSSREAVRPITHQNKIPYFYGAVYEGGVCDRYAFITGITASQGLGVLMDWAAKKYGNKYYIVAPNYNFGTISAHWVHEYAKKSGGKVVGEDFLPLSQSNFSSTLQKIQRSDANVVVALPVGAKQTSFYEQFAAAGLKDHIGIVSTNYGSGNQQVVVSPQGGEGIVASQNYFMVLDNPQNDEFVKLWAEEYGKIEEPIISEANDSWNSVMMWAKAANEIATTDSEKVIDRLQKGIVFQGPEGEVKMLPSHHLMHQVYLARGDDKHSFEIIEHFKNVMPSYEESVCNLIEHPEINKQFIP